MPEPDRDGRSDRRPHELERLLEHQMRVQAALAPLERLLLGSWRWPAEPSWFFASTDLLAFANPDGPWPSGPSDHFDVLIAATTRDGLAYLRDVKEVEWDRPPD